jgi:large subunit ribosomal protein L32e
MPKKFLRRSVDRYSKLGLRRKKKQKWRRPTGRDNKMREKRRGYPAVVSIGYKKSEGTRKKFLIIRNPKDLEKIKKNEIIIIGNVGKKKKIEIANKAKEKKIEISNMNIKKFLKKTEAGKKKEEEKSAKKQKSKVKNKEEGK